VTVDLRGDTATDTDTAKRGTETDTLTGIEGAIAAGGADRFWGDAQGNWFQGGGGKDTFTGGGGRDLYDYNLTSASPTGSGRDVITDFVHLQDDIALMGIDADTTVAGNQAFRWVGTAALTGAAEGEIQLTGIKTLTALDFYL
jgi:Ca2+-binding RTX toxin-like protein